MCVCVGGGGWSVSGVCVCGGGGVGVCIVCVVIISRKSYKECLCYKVISWSTGCILLKHTHTHTHTHTHSVVHCVFSIYFMNTHTNSDIT